MDYTHASYIALLCTHDAMQLEAGTQEQAESKEAPGAVTEAVTAAAAAIEAATAPVSPAGWGRLNLQCGMFAWTGMTAAQVDELREKHHVYCSKSGRVSIAGMTEKDVPTVAAAILAVTHE